MSTTIPKSAWGPDLGVEQEGLQGLREARIPCRSASGISVIFSTASSKVCPVRMKLLGGVPADSHPAGILGSSNSSSRVRGGVHVVYPSRP